MVDYVVDTRQYSSYSWSHENGYPHGKYTPGQYDKDTEIISLDVYDISDGVTAVLVAIMDVPKDCSMQHVKACMLDRLVEYELFPDGIRENPDRLVLFGGEDPTKFTTFDQMNKARCHGERLKSPATDYGVIQHAKVHFDY